MADTTTRLLLLSSLLLAFRLIHGETGELAWAKKAAEEAVAVAGKDCSGHGRAYVDGVLEDGSPVCECNNCYGGPDCSKLLPNCSADVKVGDPMFLEPYWRRHAESSAVVVSGWHRMSYDTDGDFHTGKELEKHIRLLHKAVGNAADEGKFIMFGAGSTQLLNAAVLALSPDDAAKPASVVATVPYYPAYKTQTQFFKSKVFEWRGATSDFVNSSERFIEFVTSPNNPDGFLQSPILKNGSSVIFDRAYYWPHYTAIKAPADEDLMLFTISKLTGHAGSRFGWALIRNASVYAKVVEYMEQNTMGVPRETQLRALKLLKTVLANVKREGDMLRFGHRTLRQRWLELSKVVRSSSRFSLQKLAPEYCFYFGKVRDPSPAYAWVKCEDSIRDRDCNRVFKEGGVGAREGTAYGASSSYVRLSLIKTRDDFDQLLQRLKALV